MLRLDDRWIWDMWFAHDGDRHHAFFLNAPRSLIDPDDRHVYARVGHAVSEDLREWTVLGDALAPSTGPAWDDFTTWTGSVVRAPDGMWWMFYTGTSRRERALVQRVGAAVSTDLHEWRRVGDAPLVQADGRWYERWPARGLSREAVWHDEAWRDPFVFADPDGDGWHMLLTARRLPVADLGDNAADRGVIGHARSADLRTWQVQPPLTTGGGFGQLEVTQVQLVDGVPVLVFSCGPDELGPARAAAGHGSAVWSVVGASLLGPFDISAARPFPDTTLYAGRLVDDGTGRWVMMGFRNMVDGGFVGEMADPVPVKVDGDGLVPMEV